MKSGAEIEGMKQAASSNNRAEDEILDNVKAGMTEDGLCGRLSMNMTEYVDSHSISP